MWDQRPLSTHVGSVSTEVGPGDVGSVSTEVGPGEVGSVSTDVGPVPGLGDGGDRVIVEVVELPFDKTGLVLRLGIGGR